MSEKFSVNCGDAVGIFHVGKFGPGSRSQCIRYKDSSWLTPVEFEGLSGIRNSSSHNWRRSIRSQGRSLGQLLKAQIIKECGKGCDCHLCKGGNKGKFEDNDSDSGISVASNQQQLPLDSSFESNTSSKVLPDFPSLIQEAIAHLEVNGGGCSRLNILLYILHKYEPTEEIHLINSKLKKSLSFLIRMKVITKSFLDGVAHSDSDDDDDEVLHRDASLEMEEEEEEKEEQKKNVRGRPRLKNDSSRSEKSVKKSTTKKSKTTTKAATTGNKDVEKPVVKNKTVGKPKMLSPALSAVCGVKKCSRQDVIRRIWIYIRNKKLQHPTTKGIIVCDDKLKAVMKKKKITHKEMFANIGQHMSDLS